MTSASSYLQGCNYRTFHKTSINLLFSQLSIILTFRWQIFIYKLNEYLLTSWWKNKNSNWKSNLFEIKVLHLILISLDKGAAIQAAMFGAGEPDVGDDSAQRAVVHVPRASREEPLRVAAAAARSHHVLLGRSGCCRRQDHRPGDRVEAFGWREAQVRTLKINLKTYSE